MDTSDAKYAQPSACGIRFAQLRSGITPTTAAFVGIALSLSCMLITGCGGSTDSRLVGVWENRQGFTKSIRIKFADDGSMIVATKTDGRSSEPMHGSWHVATTDSKRITINISLKGKTRQRWVTFLGEDLIEMSEGGDSGVRRFSRVADD